MKNSNRAISIRTDDVRAGSEENVVRYVLGVSLAMALAGQSLIWISYASL